MEVKRNKAEPVTLPPDTIDITGLTLREAGALKRLLIQGVIWDDQEKDLGEFFNRLYHDLSDTPFVKLDFSDLHGK